MTSEKKLYRVIIASEANDRLFDYFEFLARVSKTAANKLLDGLLKDIRKLQTEPFRYPIYNRPYLQVGKYRSMISCERYRIVYLIHDDQVFVDDIQDCRQDDDKSTLHK